LLSQTIRSVTAVDRSGYFCGNGLDVNKLTQARCAKQVLTFNQSLQELFNLVALLSAN